MGTLIQTNINQISTSSYMRCTKCHKRVKIPKGITRETQVCGTCRGAFRGRPRSRLG